MCNLPTATIYVLDVKQGKSHNDFFLKLGVL